MFEGIKPIEVAIHFHNRDSKGDICMYHSDCDSERRSVHYSTIRMIAKGGSCTVNARKSTTPLSPQIFKNTILPPKMDVFVLGLGLGWVGRSSVSCHPFEIFALISERVTKNRCIGSWADRGIGTRKQCQEQKRQRIDENNARENLKRLEHDYAPGERVLITTADYHKMEPPREGLYPISRVHANGTLTIQKTRVEQRINIRQCTPYVEAPE